MLSWLVRKRFVESRHVFWSAALGRVWPENGRAGGGRGLVTASGAIRTPKGGAVHRIPRFPPLADQVLSLLVRMRPCTAGIPRDALPC